MSDDDNVVPLNSRWQLPDEPAPAPAPVPAGSPAGSPGLQTLLAEIASKADFFDATGLQLDAAFCQRFIRLSIEEQRIVHDALTAKIASFEPKPLTERHPILEDANMSDTIAIPRILLRNLVNAAWHALCGAQPGENPATVAEQQTLYLTIEAARRMLQMAANADAGIRLSIIEPLVPGQDAVPLTDINDTITGDPF